MAESVTTTITATNGSNTNSTMAVFAWIGAILINAAFVVLISWGASTNWLIGFVFSIIYAILLVFTTSWIHRYNQKATNGGSGHTILTTLLYLLAAVAIGVPGIVLILNLIYCPENQNYTPRTWYTNTTGFSEEVAAWVHSDHSTEITATFAHIPDTQTTIFAAHSQASGYSSIWKTTGGEAPTMLNSTLVNPADFIQVSNDTLACFTAQHSANDYTSVIACTEGESVNSTSARVYLPQYLFYADGRIWFVTYEYSYYSTDAPVYSVDPSDLSNVTSHSTLVSPSAENDQSAEGSGDCDTEHVRRFRSFGVLVLSIVPVFIVSIWWQIRRGVPSLPLVTYNSITGMLVALAYIINPAWDGIEDLLRWWLSLSSLMWLLALTFAHLTNRMNASTLSWSINFAGLVFFVGMIMLFEVPFGSSEDDVWWRWVLITVVAFLPLIVLGVIVSRLLLIVLGAMGILIDVWRFVYFVTDPLEDGVRVALQAVILALVGLALALLGLFLSKRQPQFREMIDAWSEKHLGRWKMTDGATDRDEISTAHGEGNEELPMLSEQGEASAEEAVPAVI